jgi:hypothetical protein
MPAELILFGEQRMVEAFQQNPPDYVIVIPNNLSEMGYKSFAHDYALGIARWVEQNYDALPQTGANNPNQVLFLRHKGLAASNEDDSPAEPALPPDK